MIGEKEERWREVCEQVAVEQDPNPNYSGI